jgi:hypothetical protein
VPGARLSASFSVDAAAAAFAAAFSSAIAFFDRRQVERSHCGAAMICLCCRGDLIETWLRQQR